MSAIPPSLPRHAPAQLWRGGIRLAIIAAVGLAVVLLAPGLGAVRTRLGGLDAGWLLVAAAAEVLSVAGYVLLFRAVFAPDRSWRFSLRVGLAEVAVVALLPVGGVGGLAFGAWILRREGVPAASIARRSVAFFVATSAVNFGAIVVLGALTVLGLGGADGRDLTLAAAAGAGLVIVALAVAGPRLEGLARRPGRVGTLARALAEGLRELPRLARRPAVWAGAIGYWAFDALALWAALQAVGDPIGFDVAAMGHLLGMLGGLLPAPGGVGGVDAGLVSVLLAYGTPTGAAVAAVLAFRTIAVWVPLMLGLPALAALLRARGRVRSAVGV